MTTTTLDEPLTQTSYETAEPLTNTQDSEASPNTAVPSDTASAEAPTPSAEADSPAAPTSSDDDDEDPVLSLERDATDFEKATITVVLQLLPEDGHDEGRLVLLGVKSHNLPPLTITRRYAQLSPLPEELAQLLTKWESHYREALAARTSKRAADKAKEKAKEEERKRKQEESRRNAKTKSTAKTTAARTITEAVSTPSAGPVVPAPPAEAVSQSTLF